MTPPPNLPAGYELLPAPFLREHGAVEGMKIQPKGVPKPWENWMNDSKERPSDYHLESWNFIAPTGTIAAATTPLPEPRCDCAYGRPPFVAFASTQDGCSPTCASRLRYRHILPGELAKMPTKPEGLLCAYQGTQDWKAGVEWPFVLSPNEHFAYALPLPPQPEKGKGGEEIERQIWSELEPTEGGETCAPSSTDSAPATTCSPVTSTQTAHSTGASNAAPKVQPLADAATHALPDEEVRVRIAEWMGWTNFETVDTPSGKRTYGFPPNHQPHDIRSVPPAFTTSLDAIASAEARLTREQCNTYNSLLMEGKPPRSEMTCEAEKWSWHSSARTRSLALLLTINSKLP